jgi:hypothetical protein
MINPIRRVCEGRASLLAGVAASVAALLAVPSLTPLSAAPLGDEVFVSAGHVTVPGNPLTAFDISWIDPNLVEYFLADRSNAAIDVIPLILNPPVFPIKPTGVNAFAGATGNNDTSGPNGIITFNDPNNPIGIQLWAGDGPTFATQCGVMQPCSTVKVFTGNGSLTSVIPTFGNARADELCWAPPIGTGFAGKPGLVMVANDADTPFPFDSVIPTDTNGGANPNIVAPGGKIVLTFANGIEQCQFDTSNGNFYQSLPSTTLGSGAGGVIVWTRGPSSTGVPLTFLGFFQINNLTQCTAPQGMAIGPRQGGTDLFNPFNSDILLGCNGNVPPANNTVTVWKGVPFTITNTYRGAGGGDQVWYNSLGPTGFQGHYFVASGTPSVTGGVMFTTIMDPLLPNSFLAFNDNALDQTITTGFKGGSAGSNHSLAAWSGTPGIGTPNALPLLEVVVIPIIGTNGSPPSQSTLCGADAAKGCVSFFVISPPATFPDNSAAENF